MILTLVLLAQTGFVYEDVFLEHRTGEGFPERPARLEAIVGRLKETGLTERLTKLTPREDAVDWIPELHTRDYIERVKRVCATAVEGETTIDTRDVPVSKRSYDAAVTAVGGVLAAVDAVAAGKIRTAFCAVRPPGHHALREKAMGFCLFNTVAIAARYAQKKHGMARILVVDWDVHHGNGTQDAFFDDPSVMLFDTHLAPFYPGTGAAEERGRGNIFNVPLPAGAGDAEVLKAYEASLVPAATAFKPDLILISCGFDSAKGDRLGRMAITADGYARMTRLVKGLQEKGRVISVLEGGYTLENLAACSEAHVRALLD
ncbi:MAG TPA: histone deacetylase [Planctomycetota bacterium]|nr:histone deacetylase [Planctomycetota bacterium]